MRKCIGCMRQEIVKHVYILREDWGGKSVCKGQSSSGFSAWFFFSSRRRHTRVQGDWSSEVCSSDLFDRVILDKKIESRERYMKILPRLCKQVEKLGGTITENYAKLSSSSSKKDSKRLKAFQRTLASLQRLYPKFYFKQKVTEEFVHLADEHYATLVSVQSEMAKHRRAGARSPVGLKARDLEKALWLSLDEY